MVLIVSNLTGGGEESEHVIVVVGCICKGDAKWRSEVVFEVLG
jgi:hypothetical protein